MSANLWSPVTLAPRRYALSFVEAFTERWLGLLQHLSACALAGW